MITLDFEWPDLIICGFGLVSSSMVRWTLNPRGIWKDWTLGKHVGLLTMLGIAWCTTSFLFFYFFALHCGILFIIDSYTALVLQLGRSYGYTVDIGRLHFCAQNTYCIQTKEVYYAISNM